MRAYLRAAIVAVLFLCAGASAHAQTQRHDSYETSVALAALFMASEEIFVPGSSCYGSYFSDQRPPRVGHFLGVWMSNLDIGKNTIYGSCKGNKCSVHIYHAYGEDVSSAVIRFRSKNGKARVGTMECHTTP